MKDLFIQATIEYLELNLPRVKKCLDLLSEEECWQRPNPSTVSVGNLIIHLCGNITQYIHAGLGDEPDHRQREKEFLAIGGWNKVQLYDKLETVVHKACEVIKQLKEEDLVKIYSIQGFEMTGVSTLVHVTEHFSYHVGQIAYWTKVVRNQDLGFYADMDLDVTS